MELTVAVRVVNMFGLHPDQVGRVAESAWLSGVITYLTE
jgi:hypothetical protein